MATRDEIADSIAGMAIFVDLARPQLMGVASRFEEAFFPKDARVLRQGLTGSGFYIILDGEADVIARQGDIGTGFFVVITGMVRVVRDGEVVAHLGPGEFFGELSVLDRMPRNATVAAEIATSCLALASWDFEKVLLEQPALTLSILRGVAARLRTVTDSTRH